MPIYEYKCTKGHVFDVMQRMSDEPLKRCEVCGAAAQRVLHAPAVHFKGSGFYNTDYGTRRRSREAKENEGKSSDGTSSPTETKKSESAKADSSSGTTSGSSNPASAA